MNKVNVSKVNDFSKAKVGDKVWSLHYGQGFIKDIATNESTYPVEVTFKYSLEDGFADFFLESFTFDGKSYDAALHPDLYRTQPTVTAPEPKEKLNVNKAIVFYRYSSDMQSDTSRIATFDTTAEADIFMVRIRDSGHRVLSYEKLEREFEV